MRAKVYLQSTKQHSVLKGHPWVFPKAIAHHQGKLITGDLVDIYTSSEECLGVGVYNEHSLYCVRVLALASDGIMFNGLSELINHRLAQAMQLRQALGLPNTQTTAYRLFNSEADGLSGLTIDRFNQTCVLASSAYWVEAHRNEIMQCLQAVLPNDHLIWLPQPKPLKQDGWNVESSRVESKHEVISEGGVRYHIDFSNMQKTGLFLDQRENHQRIGALAKGKRVLDLYSYSGGFALHAAMGGAQAVTAVDSSSQAIDVASKNAKLNQIESIQFIEGDARAYLSHASDYDLVILDPPKLIPSQRHLERAKNYYRFLHREVFKVMQPGALLMTCNCSAALSSNEFATLVATQAAFVQKQVRMLGVFGPASCHPTLPFFPEGHYLTALLLAVF